jgi:hypothetical protein
MEARPGLDGNRKVVGLITRPIVKLGLPIETPGGPWPTVPVRLALLETSNIL